MPEYFYCEHCHTYLRDPKVNHVCEGLDSCSVGCTFQCPKCGTLPVKWLTKFVMPGEAVN